MSKKHNKRRSHHGPPGEGGGSSQRPSQPAPPEKEYAKDYFYTESGVIRRELLDQKAKQRAMSFIHPKDQRQKALTSHQLRRFFGEVKSLKDRVHAFGWEKTFPMIRMLKSKIAYTCPSGGKGGDKKVPDEFREYIEEMVNHVYTERDFEAFALSFEAVVGYFYGEVGR